MLIIGLKCTKSHLHASGDSKIFAGGKSRGSSFQGQGKGTGKGGGREGKRKEMKGKEGEREGWEVKGREKKGESRKGREERRGEVGRVMKLETGHRL
jgi:hypothetical protein